MADYSGGSVAIRVVPDFRGIQTTIDATFARLGTVAGRAFTDSFNRTAAPQLGPSPSSTTRQATVSAGTFADAFKAKLAAATRSLPPIVLDANSTDADRSLAAVRAQMDALSQKRIGIDLTDEQALAELDRLQARLTRLSTETPSVRVKTDTAAALAQLVAFKAEVDKINGADVKVKVDTAGAGAATAAAGAAGAAGGEGGGLLEAATPALIGGGVAAAASIGPAVAVALPALVGLGGAVAAIGLSMKGLTADFAPLVAGFKGLSAPITAIMTSGVAPLVKTLTASLIPALKTGIGAVADGLNTVLSAVLKVAAAPGVLKGLTTVLTTFGTILSKDIAPVIPYVADTLLTLATAALPGLQQLTGLLTTVAGTFDAFLTNLPAGRLQQVISSAVSGVGTLLSVVGDVVAALGPALSAIGGGVIDVLGALGGVVRSLAPVFTTLGAAFGTVLEAAAPIISELASALLPLLKTAAPIVAQLAITLAGGLVLAFRALMPAINTLVPIIGQIVAQFGAQLIGAITGLIPLVVRVVTAFSAMILALPPGAIKAIVVAVLGIVAVFTSVIPTALAVVAVLVELWGHSQTFRTIVKGAFDAVAASFTALGDGISFAWTNIIKPTWDALKSAATFMYNNVLKPTFDALKAAFDATAHGIHVAWTDVIYPVLYLFGSVAKALFDNTLAPTFGFISGHWSDMTSAMKTAYDTVLAPVFDALGSVISNDVAPAFKSGVAAIGNAWDDLKDKTKGPVKFVINTVLNNGLIAGFNKVADFFEGGDAKHIAKIPLPSGFATGGIYPGYTPGRDVGYIGVSGGEAIMRPEYTRAVGADYIHAANAAARSGGIDGVKRFLGGFRSGGIIKLGQYFQAHGAKVTENADFGGVAPVHAKNSRHYAKPPDNAAIDVNTQPGESALEQRQLQPLAQYAVRNGFNVIFKEAGHYNHLHVDTDPLGQESTKDGGAAYILKTLGLKPSDVGGGGGFLSDIKGAAGDVAGFATDLFDKIAHPLAAMKDAVTSKLSAIGSSPFAGVIANAPKQLLGDAVSHIGGMLGRSGSDATDDEDSMAQFSGKLPSGSGVTRWTDDVKQVLGMLNLSQAPSMVARVLRQMQTESGGDPNIVQSAAVHDVNDTPAKRARGLMQVVPGTFAQFRDPLLPNDIFDPLANIYAGLNYAQKKYGAGLSFLGEGHGYAKGGIVPTLYDQGGYLPPGLTTVMNATGKPEPVLLPGQLKDLADAAQKKSGGYNGPMVQVDNITATDPDRATRALMDRFSQALAINQIRSA